MKLRMAVFLVACVTGVTIAVLWGTLRGRLVRAPYKLVTTESGERDPKNDPGWDWQRSPVLLTASRSAGFFR